MQTKVSRTVSAGLAGQAVRLEHVTDLPCRLAVYPSATDSSAVDLYDVAIWKSNVNVCEYRDESECSAEAGIFFGTRDRSEPVLCPRHYFGQMFGTDAYCRWVRTEE